jgi:Smg protein
MKETSLLEVLLFLVANHIAEKSEAEQEKIKAELEEAGIPFNKLVKIASWLKDLLQNIELQDSPKQTLRVFTEEETEKMDAVARGCILFLEQTGALNATSREWLIEQAMDLDTDQIGIEELQNLLSLVLFQQYGQRNILKQDKCLIITNPQAVH